MSLLTHRMQILLDDARYQRLEHRARKQGTSIALLVREAIDVAYPAEGVSRAEAAAAFLAEPPMDLPEWPILKGEIEDGLLRGLPG